jgi:WD40 repeat protein
VTGDGTVYLVDPVSGEAQHLPGDYPGTPDDLVFSADGDVLVVSGATTLGLWNAQMGTLQRTEAGTGCALYGSQLATVGAAGDIEVRDLASGVVVGSLPAGGDVSALAFNADGSLLALGYADGTVAVWDAVTYTHRRSLMGHTARIRQLAFGGSLLASRDADDTIRLWGIPAFAASSPLDLTIGGRATVHVTGGDVLNVRGGAGLDFAVLDKLEDGTPVTVIGGPAYADGLTWWRVQTPGEVEGWAVDFADNVQTLVPSE